MWQAADRLHRIGQTKQVCVYRLVYKKTIEENLLDLLTNDEPQATSSTQVHRSWFDALFA